MCVLMATCATSRCQWSFAWPNLPTGNFVGQAMRGRRGTK